MKITKVEVLPVAIPYPHTFKTAQREKPLQGDIIIKVHTDEGIVGIGDASSYAGSSLALLNVVLAHELCPVVIGQDPLQIEHLIVDRLGGVDNPWPRALSVVDMALWDIAGKYHKKPLHELLGGAVRHRMTISQSLSIDTPEKVAEQAVALKQQGYKLLTLKIGLDAQDDLKRVKAVKKAVGDSVAVEVDGNEGYTLDNAIKYLKQMDDMISACEQPLQRGDWLGMAELARVLDTPLIMDQGVTSARDVARIARLKAADVICIKLGPFGGITLARKAVTVAQAHGLPCSISAGHTLGPGTAAMHHFAAAHSWVREPIGYGSPLELLPDDICVDPIRVVNGAVDVRTGHGLGVDLDEAKMKKYAYKMRLDLETPVTKAVAEAQPWKSSI